MAHAIHRGFALRAGAAVLAGGLLGGYLGLASAQEQSSGSLDPECARSCAASGHDAEFCGNVCWVPDLTRSAEAENLDWKCMTDCGARGGTTRLCLANCRRY